MAELNRAQLASGMAEKLKQHEERARYGMFFHPRCTIHIYFELENLLLHFRMCSVETTINSSLSRNPFATACGRCDLSNEGAFGSAKKSSSSRPRKTPRGGWKGPTHAGRNTGRGSSEKPTKPTRRWDFVVQSVLHCHCRGETGRTTGIWRAQYWVDIVMITKVFESRAPERDATRLGLAAMSRR